MGILYELRKCISGLFIKFKQEIIFNVLARELISRKHQKYNRFH